MKYILMHKNIPVMSINIFEETGTITKILSVYSEAHMPVGIRVKKSIVDRGALNEWWLDRSIPASRRGVREALGAMGLQSTSLLLTRCLGLSLSDHYWVCPSDNKIKWEDINFFQHEFSEDVGDLLIGRHIKGKINLMSPDNTSDGFLRKRWKIINGKRCLLKAGSGTERQQTFNEVAADRVMSSLGIPHVPYWIVWDEGEPYSACEDFVTEDTELVSAWRVMQSVQRSNSTSVYQHYINCCSGLGIADIRNTVDRMIVVDFIIANEDRHLNNFGLLRDANTLKWLGSAPIFDNGSSFGYDKPVGQIRSGIKIGCKPFKSTHEEQLKLVTSFDWINFEKLRQAVPEIRDIFLDSGDYIDETRTEAIVSSMVRRIDRLEEITKSCRQFSDNIVFDVTENKAAEY